MKFGIYFAFWEKEWKVSYEKYIKKVAGLGFDILEISNYQIGRASCRERV